MCQNGGTLSPIQIDDFDVIVAAFSGRISMAATFLKKTFGPRKDWTHHKHRKSIEAKRDFAVEEEGGLYVVGPSPLRRVEVMLPSSTFKTDTEIEVTTHMKATVPREGFDIDRFRRRKYSAISSPEGFEFGKTFKFEKMVCETITEVGPRSFWARLGKPPALPTRPPPAVPESAPEKKKLAVDGAAAEDFPVVGDKKAGKLQVFRDMPARPKLLRHPPGIPVPQSKMAQLQASLMAHKRPLSPKPRMELTGNQSKLLNLFNPQTPPAIPVATAEQPSVIMPPQPFCRFPDVVLTCLPEQVEEQFAPTQQTQSSSNNGSPTGVKLPSHTLSEHSQQPTMDEPVAHAVFLPNKVTLVFGEGVVPPHPDTVHMAQGQAGAQGSDSGSEEQANDESVPPNNVQDAEMADPQEHSSAPDCYLHAIVHAQLDDEGRQVSTAPDHLYRSTSESTWDGQPQADPVPQPGPAPPASGRPRRITNWADEMEDELDFAPPAAPPPPSSGNVTAVPTTEDDTVLLDSDDLSERTETAPLPPPTSAPASTPPLAPASPASPSPWHPSLHPAMFLNPDELDQSHTYETYTYGARGEVPTILRSNLRTIINPRLSRREQEARNRSVARLNFGSFAEEMEMEDV